MWKWQHFSLRTLVGLLSRVLVPFRQPLFRCALAGGRGQGFAGGCMGGERATVMVGEAAAKLRQNYPAVFDRTVATGQQLQEKIQQLLETAQNEGPNYIAAARQHFANLVEDTAQTASLLGAAPDAPHWETMPQTAVDRSVQESLSKKRN